GLSGSRARIPRRLSPELQRSGGEGRMGEGAGLVQDARSGMMEYRLLGHSGLKVSAVGLGCNNFGRRCSEEETRAVVHKALDLGVTTFDTADMYSTGLSEEFLGKALGARRKDVVVATKFGMPMAKGEYEGGASRRYIM